MAEKYESRGDVNFFDAGILIMEVAEKQFNIITCSLDVDNDENGEGNTFLLSVGAVFIDDWKEHFHDVCSIHNLRDVSIDYAEDEYKDLAIALFEEGYANYEWYSTYKRMSKNDIIDFIDYGYIDELEWDFYEANFYASHRNCVVEIHNDYAQSEKRVYDSLENALEDFKSRAEKGWSLTVIDK